MSRVPVLLAPAACMRQASSAYRAAPLLQIIGDADFELRRMRLGADGRCR